MGSSYAAMEVAGWTGLRTIHHCGLHLSSELPCVLTKDHNCTNCSSDFNSCTYVKCDILDKIVGFHFQILFSFHSYVVFFLKVSLTV